MAAGGEMEKEADEVEWLAALPEKADNDPASWSCLLLLLGCHFQNPMAGWERGGRRLGFAVSN